MDAIRERARGARSRVVLPEGGDRRVQEAALQLARDGLAEPVLLGDRAVVDLPAESAIERQLLVGSRMVAEGQVHAMVAGTTCSTSQVLAASELSIGCAEGVPAPSSFFLMVWPEDSLVFADAAVTVEPSAEELAGIAALTACNAGILLGIEPRVALLAGSSRSTPDASPLAGCIQEAVLAARELAPGLAIDGPLSVKVALADAGAVSILPDSPLCEAANVLVFPHLDAAHTGYKLTQCLAGGRVIGPVLQGLAKPVASLSRRASVQDIVDMATIASVLA